MEKGTFGNKFRKWSRIIHRDLSFFFSGVIVVYAVSGLMLNHKQDFNSDYSITRHEYRVETGFPRSQEGYTRDYVLGLLERWKESKNYTRHYFPEENRMKVFLKGGSSLVMDIRSGEVIYESVRKRPVISRFNRLHYNPGRWWTVFSDVFVVSLLIITFTGIVMLKGPKGLWGRGGVELVAGILIPLLFMFMG